MSHHRFNEPQRLYNHLLKYMSFDTC